MMFPAGSDRLLETLRGERGVALRWRLNAERMRCSAVEFGILFSMEEFGAAVARAASEAVDSAPCRIRVTLDTKSQLKSELLPLPPAPDRLRLVLSQARVASDSLLSRHKLLPRGLYDQIRLEAEGLGAWDGILVNQRGELCETGRANLILLLDGELLTPQLASGVLQGTVRRVLLAAGVIRESVLSQARLEQASALFVSNALIGVREVVGVDGAEFIPDPDASGEALKKLRAALSK